MRVRRNMFVVLAAAVWALLSWSPANAETPGEVLRRQPLSGGRELVVVKEPMVPAAIMQGMDPYKDNAGTPVLGDFAVSVEVRSADGPSLRLWSRPFKVYRKGGYDEWQVLDLMVVPDVMVAIVLGREGSDISAVNIPFTVAPPVDMTTLQGADWSLLAAPITAPPGRLGAKLSYDEKAKTVEIEVTDSQHAMTQQTLFRQKDGQWKFERVKQWKGKDPATRPAAAGQRPGKPARGQSD